MPRRKLDDTYWSKTKGYQAMYVKVKPSCVKPRIYLDVTPKQAQQDKKRLKTVTKAW